MSATFRILRWPIVFLLFAHPSLSRPVSGNLFPNHPRQQYSLTMRACSELRSHMAERVRGQVCLVQLEPSNWSCLCVTPRQEVGRSSLVAFAFLSFRESCPLLTSYHHITFRTSLSPSHRRHTRIHTSNIHSHALGQVFEVRS